jgi:hypothetical protein
MSIVDHYISSDSTLLFYLLMASRGKRNHGITHSLTPLYAPKQE